ncbi:hypothetical protein SDJN03_09719, partial [Cucurbita argyrosperma subsp. sororia]
MNTLVAEIFVVFLSGASLLFFLRTQLSSASHVHGLSAFYKAKRWKALKIPLGSRLTEALTDGIAPFANAVSLFACRMHQIWPTLTQSSVNEELR